jgi:hypothetical protein
MIFLLQLGPVNPMRFALTFQEQLDVYGVQISRVWPLSEFAVGKYRADCYRKGFKASVSRDFLHGGD